MAEYATYERCRQLAEDLHHEARLERITAILHDALEKAYDEGLNVARNFYTHPGVRK